ncbi:hypothetical protein AB0C34_18040 [Nocardia sp. NPDC049220]|uniref:hypothetical protein n=1 Tax=Nocardia sp. NPDC049220 TaxID=3155273 RepID=UPI0033DDCC3D
MCGEFPCMAAEPETTHHNRSRNTVRIDEAPIRAAVLAMGKQWCFPDHLGSRAAYEVVRLGGRIALETVRASHIHRDGYSDLRTNMPAAFSGGIQPPEHRGGWGRKDSQ